MLLAWISAALAAEPSLAPGGGIDLFGGVLLPAGGPTPLFGLRTIEGALLVEGAPVSARVDLDAEAWIGPSSASVVTLRPEQLWVKVDAGRAWALVGAFVSPMRVEAVDPWDNPLVTTGFVAGRLPGTLLGADLAIGGEEARVRLLGGLDAGPGVDLLTPLGYQLDAAPAVLAARGEVTPGNWGLGGGPAWWVDQARWAVEIDGWWGSEQVRVETLGLIAFDGPSAVMLGLEGLPDGVVSPAARVEWEEGAFAFAGGVAWRPASMVKVTGEAGWAGGTPSILASVDLYRRPEDGPVRRRKK